MPGQYRIFPDRGLIYIRYEGLVTLTEAEALFAEYMAHPDAHPRMKRLFDLSRVDTWDVDFIRLMTVHAENAKAFTENGGEAFIVVYAPTKIAHDLARLITEPWAGIPGMVTSIQPDEATALTILGQAENSFDALFVPDIA